MKVLLTHGYFISEDPKEQKIMRPYAPLGILYLSAFLKQKGVNTSVFDTTFSTRAEFNSYLLGSKPDFIGIYVNLMTKLNVLETIKFVRNHPELKHTRIILGGPEVRYHAEKFLRFGAHALVIGEGEETFYDLITTLSTPLNPFLDQVNGIAFINGLGEVVFTPEREKIKDIDQLPFPDREAIDLNKYLETWKTHHGQSAMSLSTMRGCPYTCKWCSRAVYGLSYRRRSPELVVEEIQWIQQRYEVDTFWIVDDVFTVSHKWLRGFRDALVARGVTLKYECITRADRMNEEVTDLLLETGCFRVWIGAESGSQRIIDAMDRRVSVEQVREMIQLTRKKGMQAGTFIMLGYPGETESDIEETIHHLTESSPDIFTITVAYPIKGTELYQEVEADFTEELKWEASNDRMIDFKRTYPRRFYEFAVRRVVNEVEFRKKWRSGDFLSALNHKTRSIAAKMGMKMNRGGKGNQAAL